VRGNPPIEGRPYEPRRAYGHLYGRRWRKRRDAFKRANPLCVMCAAEGVLTPTAVIDHIVPHKGNEELFWNGALQALCTACHNSTKQHYERGKVQAIGLDGWPIA
jgi:5-methylcytosine-specific restriction protein A